MAFFGLLSGLAPLIPSGFQFIKSHLNLPSLIKGGAIVKDLARKASEVISSISAGLQTAKELPGIGKAVKAVLKKVPLQKVIKKASEALQEVKGEVSRKSKKVEKQLEMIQKMKTGRKSGEVRYDADGEIMNERIERPSVIQRTRA